jgi:hypothetical protein
MRGRGAILIVGRTTQLAVATRCALVACTCVVLSSAPAPAEADPVRSCTGVPDGTPCADDGDGCFYDDGNDRCSAGACRSPAPCARTTFSPLPRGGLLMAWSKDPKDVDRGEFCEGDGFVTPEMVRAITGIAPAVEDGLVPVTSTGGSRRTVPPSGRVHLRLRLNHFGRLLFGAASRQTIEVTVVARMTLTKPNGRVVAANRIVTLLRRRR